MLSAIIVDDEPYARAKLERLLGDEDAEILAVCAHGEEAVPAIEELRPDLVFLDIQMPGMDGFEVLRAIDPARRPEFVFVTAYDQYALQAFEVNALDYLLKPFDRERFRAALARAECRLRGGAHGAQAIERLLTHLAALGGGAPAAEPAPQRHHLEWIFVRKGNRAARLTVAEIDWFEAQGNYVRIHAAGDTYLIRERMTALVDRLDPRRFARIHRTAIVNLSYIKEMRPWSNSAFTVILRDGTELRLSRRYRSRLASTIGEYL